MKKLLFVFCLLLASCSFAPTVPPVVWKKNVNGEFGGIAYSVTTNEQSLCSMEYPIPQIEHEGNRLFLLASSPFDQEPFLLQLKTITSQFVRVTTFRILNERDGDKMRFLGMADVPYDSKNDVFEKYCAGAVKNGVVSVSGEATEPFPEELLKAFRGEYGIGK